MCKQFKLGEEDIQDIATGHGACIATDEITVLGKPVGYMYRDEPTDESDSGWCFMSGEETPEYMEDVNNHGIFDVNVIANYDLDVVPHLGAPVGSEFERDEYGELVEVVE